MASRDGVPFIVRTDHGKLSREALERLPLIQTPKEEWLQALLDQGPDLLPMQEIDDRIKPPLVSLGREVSTPAGPIDNLFLSQNGYLVVVETKLWRNPEARRQVVAQLIDYAAQLRGWRYSNLDTIVRHNGRSQGKSLWEFVKPEDFDEHDWIDQINENLSRGRMSLLVVGDGIRSEAEALVEALRGYPDFHFRLALVEMRVFALRDGSYMVVPATLAKTAEIERAVVRLERGVVTVETPEPPPQGGRRVLSEEVLRDELRRQPNGEMAAQVADRLLDLFEPPLQLSWGSGSVKVKVPDPQGSGLMLSLCVVANTGTLYAYLDWLQDQLAKLWGDEEAVKQVSDAHVAFLRKYGAKVSPTGKQYDLKLTSLAGKEKEFVNDLIALTALIERISAQER